jgi:hypothetical protein
MERKVVRVPGAIAKREALNANGYLSQPKIPSRGVLATNKKIRKH